MGTFDISRINFDKTKHYSSVRMQQGRVLTDDDWNENERIEKEIERESNTDIIGPFGSPDDGFKIDNLRLDAGLINFDILPGILYLGGLRLELETLETYRLQKDWLQQPALSDGIPVFDEQERYDLVYLETWQQAVSAVEDSSLFEVALGGPDTTTRVRNMRRVHLAGGIGFSSCADAWNKLITDWQTGHSGTINKQFERIRDTLLKVSFSNTGLPQDLCTPSAAGGYLGAENQAIRVQLVDDNHFTWGFDNASPLYRVALSANGKTVKMLTEPKDQYHWPLANQVVEILPWSAVLSNGEKVAEEMGHLTKVETSYDPDTGEFTLKNAVAPAFGTDWKSRDDKNDLDNQTPPEYFYLRVWNRGDDLLSDAKIPITAGAIDLGHTGLQITITGNDRVANDYWIIAARPETPNRVVPWELEQGLAPHGVRRFFAPLAVIKWKREARTNGLVAGRIIRDCRIPFDPLTKKRETCIVAIPGPGWERIFENFREGEDICVCFKNAVYELDAAVILNRKGNIKFTGCGKGSQIIVHNDEAAFAFINCKDVLIRDLSLESDKTNNTERQKLLKHLNGVLTINGCENILLENLTVSCLILKKIQIRELTCITINARTEKLRPTTAVIRNCRFTVGYMQTGLLIIDTLKTIIEGNILRPLAKIGNQGIVVAGSEPKDICIKDNLITGVLQGIHIGTSNSKFKKNTVLVAGNVIISGNSIECILRNSDKTERHGIFVGNCNSLVLNENFINLKKQANEAERWPPANGIRVYGNLGKRIIIKDNHLDGYGFTTNKRVDRRFVNNIGILVHYLNSTPIPRWWIVEANVTEKLRIEGSDRLFRTSKMIYADRWREI